MSVRQIALLVAPPVLLGTTWMAFRILVARFGLKPGYFGGFAFYWIGWCLVFPWVVLGTAGVIRVFQQGASRFGEHTAVNVILLVLPLLLGYGYAFPRAIRGADWVVIVLSAALALTNGTLEELLWRGAYLRTFPDSWMLGYVYPSIGFAVWHLAPLAMVPSRAPGGSVSFVIVSGIVGLIWGLVARKSGSILWPAISHVLFDFSGLGARFYFR